MYEVRFSKQVKKFLLQCDQRIYDSFKVASEKLKIDPFDPTLDIKKMAGTNGYRLRISKYRFLYEIIDHDVIIFFYKAGGRGDVYK